MKKKSTDLEVFEEYRGLITDPLFPKFIDLLYKVRSELKKNEKENLFCPGMDLDIPRKHFKIFTLFKNSSGDPLLTPNQFELFIDRAFCGNMDIPKLEFNSENKWKKKIELEFSDFYSLNCLKYFGTTKVKRLFIKLLTDNFNGYDYNTVRNNFMPKATRYTRVDDPNKRLRHDPNFSVSDRALLNS